MYRGEFPYGQFPISISAGVCFDAIIVCNGVRRMRRTDTPRAIAIPRRSEDIQPAAILQAIGMSVALLVLWGLLVL